MLGFGSREQIQKGPVIPIGMKHGCAAVPAIEEGMADKMAARNSWHGGTSVRRKQK
jgi:hypothetical protein